MSSLSLYIALTLLVYLTTRPTDVLAQFSCIPAEEGHSYNLQCAIPSNLQDTTIIWRNRTSIICTCTHVNSPPCTCPEGFVSSLSNDDGSYTSTFTIVSSHRSQEGSLWRCTADSAVILSCDFRVYIKPKEPKCSTPLFDGMGNITVLCMADDVYPQASCHFLVQTNGSIETTKLEPTVNTVKPYHTCELAIPENSLKPGSHRFKVLMYPMIDGNLYEPGMAESSFTSAILIAPSTCQPAEENKAYTLKCTVKSLLVGNIMVWEDQVDLKCTCTAGITECNCKDGYQGTLFPDGSGVYVSTFIIDRVDRSQDGSNWTCRHVDAVYSCPFQVYALPDNPICNYPVMHTNGSLTATCMADDVYPQAACHFFRKTNGTVTEEIPPTINIVSRPYSCTLTTLASSLLYGSHEFQVKMSPVIAGQEYNKAGLSRSNFTSPVLIEIPQATLAEDCPALGSFVLINTTVTCTCLRTDSSDLPTLVTWNGTDVSDTGDSNSDLLTFTASKATADFTCTATNSIGWISSVTFNLNVAYGPDDIVVKTNGDSTLHLCTTPLEIQAQCQVPVKNVNPAPTLSFTFNQSETTAPVLGHQLNNTYMLTEIRNITSGGIFSISCISVNSAFTELSVQGNTTLSIIEPPSSPVIEILPKRTSADHSNLVLLEGVATISCQVKGGYPPVQDISLSVDSLTTTFYQVSNTSDVVIMTVNITREMTSQQFTCIVNHPSVCYEKVIKTPPILISYGPDDIVVKTNRDSTLHLCTTSVEIQAQCQVPVEMVNPAPTLSFTFNQSETTAPVLGHQDNNTYTLTETRHITSGGIFSIACMAINSAFTELSVQGNTSLSIIEPPKPLVIDIWQRGENMGNSDIVLLEDTATISCQAKGGYPPVHNISLSVGSVTATLQQVSNTSDFVRMTVDITRAMTNQHFICVVDHPSICYEKVTRTLPIQISSGDESKDGSEDNLPVILGVICGVLVLGIVALAFLVCFRRGWICGRQERKGTPYLPDLRHNTNSSSENQEGSSPANNDEAESQIDRPLPDIPTPSEGQAEESSNYYEEVRQDNSDLSGSRTPNERQAQESSNYYDEDGYVKPCSPSPSQRSIIGDSSDYSILDDQLTKALSPYQEPESVILSSSESCLFTIPTDSQVSTF